MNNYVEACRVLIINLRSVSSSSLPSIPNTVLLKVMERMLVPTERIVTEGNKILDIDRRKRFPRRHLGTADTGEVWKEPWGDLLNFTAQSFLVVITVA